MKIFILMIAMNAGDAAVENAEPDMMFFSETACREYARDWNKQYDGWAFCVEEQ